MKTNMKYSRRKQRPTYKVENSRLALAIKGLQLRPKWKVSCMITSLHFSFASRGSLTAYDLRTSLTRGFLPSLSFARSQRALGRSWTSTLNASMTIKSFYPAERVSPRARSESTTHKSRLSPFAKTNTSYPTLPYLLMSKP